MAKKKRLAKSVGLTGATLFPITRKVVWVDPAGLGTLDAKQLARCNDGCEYFIKDDSKRPLMRHAEWFCTRLAERVGISGPPCEIVELSDGTLAFGSRCEGGVIPPPPAPQWWDRVRSGEIPLADIRVALTRIYAFDHFIHNEDRHGLNFLGRQQQHGYSLLAFDYSRSWTYHGFPLPNLPFDPLDPNERTVNVQRQLTALFGPYVDPVEARQFLDTIKHLPVTIILDIISSHPKDWLPASKKKAIIKWWKSSGRADRLEQIAKGIENGTYL
jgi:hypothetical protein